MRIPKSFLALIIEEWKKGNTNSWRVKMFYLLLGRSSKIKNVIGDVVEVEFVKDKKPAYIFPDEEFALEKLDVEETTTKLKILLEKLVKPDQEEFFNHLSQFANVNANVHWFAAFSRNVIAPVVTGVAAAVTANALQDRNRQIERLQSQIDEQQQLLNRQFQLQTETSHQIITMQQQMINMQSQTLQAQATSPPPSYAIGLTAEAAIALLNQFRGETQETKKETNKETDKEKQN